MGESAILGQIQEPLNLKAALEYYDSIAAFWYNYSMKNYSNINNYTNEDYTVFQEVLPLNYRVVLPKGHKLYSFFSFNKLLVQCPRVFVFKDHFIIRTNIDQI